MFSAESYAILRDRMNSLTVHLLGVFLLRYMLQCLISKRFQLVLSGFFSAFNSKIKPGSPGFLGIS